MRTFDVTAEPAAPAARLEVHSWFIDGVHPDAPKPFVQGLPTTAAEFLSQLPPAGFSCWVRGTSGLVGLGRLVRLRACGPDRFAALARAWRALSAEARIHNEVGLAGSGLIGFSAVAFSRHSQVSSVIDVPEFVMGRREGRVWLTSIRLRDGEPGDAGKPDTRPTDVRGPGSDAGRTAHEADAFVLAETPLKLPVGARPLPGTVTAEKYTRIVTRAVERLRSSGQGLGKIVLARDEVIEAEADIDVRAVLGRLNQAYPSCWTFNVAGLIGATPELLIGVSDGQVTSRVLAGTYRVEADPAAEIAAARTQLGSAKDTREHSYAIESLAESLATVTDELHVDAEPHLLQLANVIHLASDAHGTLRRGETGLPSALEVAAAVHPTAAVGGFPKATALDAIEEFEEADRGRYAGPVGWLDDRGNGQFGIALRCGQLEARNRIRVFAGAGIMPDSDPDSELAETEAKLAPMKRALGLLP
ncbi:chorismate-binding protein [Brevibacterium daeguense]|uniref:isochorismate synthase n=1 Tax=Brevibacterium daeguense TaxID=909936 RepID=A0ABP8EL83_9MICO|nr:isochorismate synthase [Brevibacterium daeguense]